MAYKPLFKHSIGGGSVPSPDMQAWRDTQANTGLPQSPEPAQQQWERYMKETGKAPVGFGGPGGSHKKVDPNSGANVLGSSITKMKDAIRQYENPATRWMIEGAGINIDKVRSKLAELEGIYNDPESRKFVESGDSLGQVQKRIAEVLAREPASSQPQVTTPESVRTAYTPPTNYNPNPNVGPNGGLPNPPQLPGVSYPAGDQSAYSKYLADSGYNAQGPSSGMPTANPTPGTTAPDFVSNPNPAGTPFGNRYTPKRSNYKNPLKGFTDPILGPANPSGGTVR